MVFLALNSGWKHKLLHDKLDDDPYVDSAAKVESITFVAPAPKNLESASSSLSATRRERRSYGILSLWANRGTTDNSQVKQKVRSLQVNHLYSARSSNKAKPLYVVESVPVPRLVQGEKMPYLLPPRGDDDDDSFDDVVLPLPDLDRTDSTSDRQSHTDTTLDSTELVMTDLSYDMQHPVNLSLLSTTVHLGHDNYPSSTKSDSCCMHVCFPKQSGLDSVESESETDASVDEAVKGSEISVSCNIAQVESDISDPLTASSTDASVSDSDSTESRPDCFGKQTCMQNFLSFDVDASFDVSKHESLPAFYLGPITGTGVAIPKQAKEDLISAAIALHHLHQRDSFTVDQIANQNYQGKVILEGHASFWSASIPFKASKVGYYSVIDPNSVTQQPIEFSESQEASILFVRQLLQSGRIIQALNHTLSLLDHENKKEIVVLLRNASTLQMITGRFHDSVSTLKQIFSEDRPAMSVYLIMHGISLYGCEEFKESSHLFHRSLKVLRSEIQDQSLGVSSKIHLLHSMIKTLNNIGCCSLRTGDSKSAIQSFNRALGLVTTLLVDGSVREELPINFAPLDFQKLSNLRTKSMETLPVSFKYTISTILCNLAFVYVKSNEFSLSAGYLDKALKLQQQIPWHLTTSALIIDTTDSLAYCLRKTDQLSKAIKFYKLILNTKRELFRNELQYQRCMANATSFCHVLQKLKASSIEI